MKTNTKPAPDTANNPSPPDLSDPRVCGERPAFSTPVSNVPPGHWTTRLLAELGL